MQMLVGDLGASNSRFALLQGGHLDHSSFRSFPNSGHDDPAELLQLYLDQSGATGPEAVCLGVAGPVIDGAARFTNRDWQLSEQALKQRFGFRSAILLNDLQAMGYALADLPPDRITPVLPGDNSSDAARMVVAPGTGLNIAVLRPGMPVAPSESGHVALSATTMRELEFLDTLSGDFPNVPVEAALSGPGIARLYRFAGGDPDVPPVDILARARAGGDTAATEAVGMFGRFLGRYCADMALTHMPMGGVFLTGSVGVAIAPYLAATEFAGQFHRAGPYQAILESIPVYTVDDPMIGLRGCAVRLRT